MEHVTGLGLSQPLVRAQRACSSLLDRASFDPVDAFAARQSLGALDRVDHARLLRWLAWQSIARNPQALSRIERLDARLAAGVMHARTNLPVNGRPSVSETRLRTA